MLYRNLFEASRSQPGEQKPMALGNPPSAMVIEKLAPAGTPHLKLTGYQVKTRKNTK